MAGTAEAQAILAQQGRVHEGGGPQLPQRCEGSCAGIRGMLPGATIHMLSLIIAARNNALMPESKGVLLACLTVNLPALSWAWLGFQQLQFANACSHRDAVTCAFLHMAHLSVSNLLP